MKREGRCGSNRLAIIWGLLLTPTGELCVWLNKESRMAEHKVSRWGNIIKYKEIHTRKSGVNLAAIHLPYSNPNLHVVFATKELLPIAQIFCCYLHFWRFLPIITFCFLCDCENKTEGHTTHLLWQVRFLVSFSDETLAVPQQFHPLLDVCPSLMRVWRS